jgi:hypothetical protein
VEVGIFQNFLVYLRQHDQLMPVTPVEQGT